MKKYLAICTASLCTILAQFSLPSTSVAATFGLPEENLIVPYAFGVNGATTLYEYNGVPRITVSGGGQAAGSQYSDAFWLYQSDGSIVPANEFGLVINRLSPPLQSRNPSGFYQFDYSVPPVIINPGSPPGLNLTFGVGDTVVGDNTGQYYVKVQATTPSTRFTQDQKAAFRNSAENDRLNATLLGAVGSAGCLALGISFTPFSGIGCETALAGQVSLLSIRAQYYDRLALDPFDFNFTVVAQPEPIFLPNSFLASTEFAPESVVSAFNKSLQDIVNELSVADALITTIDRLDGAQYAEDFVSRDKQIAAATNYAVQLGSLQITSTNSFFEFLRALENSDELNNPFLTGDSIFDYQKILMSKGLSDSQNKVIKEFIAANQPSADGTGIGSRLEGFEKEANILFTDIMLANSLEFKSGKYTDIAISTLDGYKESGEKLKRGVIGYPPQPNPETGPTPALPPEAVPTPALPPEAVPTPALPPEAIPTPALLPGLIGMGVAALRKLKQDVEIKE